VTSSLSVFEAVIYR